jgi:hypothetical protein
VRQSANFFLELGLISSDMAVSIPLHRSTGWEHLDVNPKT